MLVVALLICIIALTGITAWLFSQKKNAELNYSNLFKRHTEISSALEQSKLSEVRLSSELKNAHLLLERERNLATNRQKELEAQLILVGKNMVADGSRVLKHESEQKLTELLAPFKERLSAFEKEVRENNKQDIERFSEMQMLVNLLSKQHAEMNTTAQGLVDALRGEQKTQGDWGELALERILESSGLEKGREYHLQSSFKSEEEGSLRLRPDVLIQLPDDKHLIIDSKVSLKAFEEYINESDSERRKSALNRHLTSIKNHIKQLAEKNYNHISGISTPDFVLMFLPLESSFALAMKEEPSLYQLAWDRKIVLVTPSTLLATLKTVASIWKQEKQSRNALEIAEQASRLYDKFVGFVNDLEKVGTKQHEAQKAYNDALSKLSEGRGNLIRSAEKLKQLGVKTKKQLDAKFLDRSHPEEDNLEN